MKLPNKLFTVKESCIGRFPIVLDIVQKRNVAVLSLYEITKKYFSSISDFVETLDALFYLGKITLNEKSEVIYNVE